MPRAVFLLGTALFVLCVAGTLLSLGVFFWYDTDFWDYFSVRPVLQVAAALLSGFVISSGMLFWHYRRQESYITFEATFFLSCLFLSLLNLLWIAPVLFFFLRTSARIRPTPVTETLFTGARRRMPSTVEPDTYIIEWLRNCRRNAWEKIIQ